MESNKKEILPQENLSGLLCLRLLLAQTRRSVNFAALITKNIHESYKSDPCQTLMKLSGEQLLRPEKLSSLEALPSYNGPILAKLNNDNWILIMNSKQLVSGEKVAVYDPVVQKDAKVLMLENAAVKEKLSTTNIIFHNLAQVASYL